MKTIETVTTSDERSISMNKPSPRPSCALPAPGEQTTSTSLQPSQTGNIGSLRQFTDAEILKTIDTRRTSLLLRRFASELGNAGLTIPAAANDQMDDDYFNRWIALLSEPAFPAVIIRSLLSIEKAALPENNQVVDNAILRCIPNIAPGVNRLDQVLELWFHAPEEFSPFMPNIEDHVEVVSSPRFEALAVPNSNPNLLDELVGLLKRFVVLPPHAAETLALWVLHTYAFKLRDVSTYIGIESPDKGCGKTTLLRLLGKLVRKPVSTANVSPSALFRVIEELQPTLLIDEGDTFLKNNDELKGILNAGYTPDTAFVLRASSEASASVDKLISGYVDKEEAAGEGQQRNETSSIAGFRRFATWCPKAIAMIGRLPDTLGDRCIIVRMQKKARAEKCERLRDLEVGNLPARCEAFVKEHADQIAKGRPLIPSELGDRAADIWEPLLVLADIAGGSWPELARTAAIFTTVKAQESSPTASLLADVRAIFEAEKTDRLWTRTITNALSQLTDRPWAELNGGKPIGERWLSLRLRPYGIVAKNVRIGNEQAKGYLLEDCLEVFERYARMPRSGT